MSSSFENKVIEILSSNPKFLVDDNLSKEKIKSYALQLDEELIGLLIKNDQIKDKFFKKIEDVFVFNLNDFIYFISDKNFLSNSYSKYKNKIGLANNSNLLNEFGDVVLDFPFKDCILEGGQTYDDSRRTEIFYNQILAPDEIDKLFDVKALTNFKKFSSSKDIKLKNITKNDEGIIKENLIIRGNNLLALHSLKSNFAGKVKLIYIDPPYNTGGDSFGYNDKFNHSTWLTFMKNRLEVARDFLKEDGVIFVQCDDNEQAYLKVLMDEIFGRDKFIGEIIWKKRSGVNDSKTNFSPNHDYILVFSKNKEVSLIGEQKHFSNYTNPDNDPKGKWTSGDLTCNKTAKERPNLYYPIIDPETGIKYECNPNRVWRTIESKMLQLIKEKKILFPKNGKGTPSYKRHLSEVRSDKQPVSSLFLNDALNQTATKEIINIFDEKKFTTPKPEALMKKIIEVSTLEGDIILDYHLGSGTTAAVAHKMNRQYIGIEQMDYIEEVVVERLKKVIAGEDGGISKDVKWKGGGSFVYCELKKWNEEAKEKILLCKNLKELEKLFDELYNKYFLNYNLKIKEFKEKTIKEDEFKKMSLKDQQRFFCDMLDLNQMYVNYSEIEDKKYNISKEEIELNKQFYGGMN